MEGVALQCSGLEILGLGLDVSSFGLRFRGFWPKEGARESFFKGPSGLNCELAEFAMGGLGLWGAVFRAAGFGPNFE